MTNLDKLYQKKIMEEARDPFHFLKMSSEVKSVRAYNPICGDRFDLYLNEGVNYFYGFGCVISKASTSLMLREIDGKTKSESLEIIQDFLSAIDLKKEILSDGLKLFQNTENFRGRLDCIKLAWKALEKHLLEDDYLF